MKVIYTHEQKRKAATAALERGRHRSQARKRAKRARRNNPQPQKRSGLSADCNRRRTLAKQREQSFARDPERRRSPERKRLALPSNAERAFMQSKKEGAPKGPFQAQSATRERDDPAFRGLHRSTSGDGGLSCRVRHGTGRFPPPWSRSRGALPARSRRSPRGRPEGRMALLRRKPSFARDRAPGRFRARMARARAISTARLNASRRLQLRPIDLVVYEGPYRRENSSRRRLPA